MYNYDPYRWYWRAEDSRIFSSASQGMVSEDDDDYQAWLTAGFMPSRWPRDDLGNQTDAALAEVLAPYGLSVGLTALKANLKLAVDAAAETERLKYITPGSGQAMTYQQKVDEARAFKAASNPLAADYPILSSEAGITAVTPAEVADVVLAAFAQWQQIGAAIETIRLGAKRDIEAAEDEATAHAVVDAIVWPSAQVQA